ncbi:MAG: putative DNA binding domain-containing protein [Prevotella sp.]|nr:putative DNA binding domain-containing protein [Prevotella sp.]
MTPEESQNVEYKQSWRDEYLKWICGFANAQGGTIFIGMNDDGSVCGVANAKRLMEDIPNKVRDVLGIVIDVNLHEQDGLQYLEIVTGAYPYPVSYKGEYHYRSGSTKQELKGAALDRFILRKQGKTWDGVPVPFVKVGDLDDASFALFRRYAKHSGRMEEADLMDDNATLLYRLRLVEGDYLKRAAVLTFHPDPERFVTGAYIKIGFFRDDLIYQDEVHGSLFQQVKQTMDLLTTKYLKALISYEGIQRIESLPMPREALREALLNSIVHKAYESLTPIQIAVYDDKLEIFNCGYLPDDWTIDNLLVSHRSRPYNPDIAHTFFRAGEIETWGRGIERIIGGCKAAGCPVPTFRYSTGEMWSVFHFSEEYQEGVGGQVSDQADGQKGSQATDLAQKITNSGITVPDADPVTVPDTVPVTVSKENVKDSIIRMIRRTPNIRKSDLAAYLGITVRGVKYHIEKLRKDGRLIWEGNSRNGHWTLIEKKRNNNNL